MIYIIRKPGGRQETRQKKGFNYYLTKEELKRVAKEVENAEEDDDYEEFDIESIITPNEGYSESSLLITVKPGLSEEEEKLAEKIAKLLENFIGTYSIESMSEY